MIVGYVSYAYCDDGAASYTEWPSGGSRQQIGEADVVIHVIDAPTSFVQYAHKLFDAPPSSWFVESYENWKPAHSLTTKVWNINIIGYKNDSITILVAPNKWIRLNEAKAIPLINKIMAPCYDVNINDKAHPLAVSQMSPTVLEGYTQAVVQLYRNIPGGGGYTRLSPEFAEAVDSYASATKIASYTSNQSRLLHSLSGPPVSRKERNDFMVSANFINTNGGIEQWTITVSPVNSLNITRINVKLLYPSGSFPDPPTFD